MKSMVLRSFKKAHFIGMFSCPCGWLFCNSGADAKSWQCSGCNSREIDGGFERPDQLGAPKIDGNDAVGGRDVPTLYFGSTKMNNNFSVVDAVAEEGGRGMAATLLPTRSPL